MRDNTLDEEQIERAEENMRKWVNMSPEEFKENLNDIHRDVSLPYHNGVRDIGLLNDFIELYDEADLDGDNYHKRRAESRMMYLE